LPYRENPIPSETNHDLLHLWKQLDWVKLLHIFHEINKGLGKTMKKIFDFWKKDIINKLIILVLSLFVVTFIAVLYFLITIPKDSIFYATFFPINNVTPTQSTTATPMSTPTTAFFPSATPPPASSATPLPHSLPKASPSPTSTIAPTQTQMILNGSPTASTIPTSDASAMACMPANPPETGKVVGVVDGNTIRVLLDSDGKIYVVRYIGIAVPKYGEGQQLYGDVSEAKNYSLVFGQKVKMTTDSTDRDSSNRLLRYVVVNNIFINLAMVQQGLASALSVPPNTACDSVFQNAQQLAQQSSLGIWSLTATPSSP
jgi:endonuclease YncB( thermonuclease family)